MHKRQAGLAFIFITIFLDMVGIGIVFPVLPELIASLRGGDVSDAARYYGYFVAVYAAMQFLFAPILGGLSDQYGRRPVLLLSLFGAGVDYCLLALAPNLALLFVGRMIAGITAASFTAANAYIADISPPEKRAQNFGVIGAAFGLGFIIGPALGGALGGLGLRAPFVAAGVLTLLNWLYGLLVLPESLAPENRRRFSWGRANPVASLGALARYPAVRSLTAAVLCSGFAQLSLQAVWVLYTSYRFGWVPWQHGLSLALVGLMAVIMQAGVIRALIPRLGERRALVVGLLTSLVSFVLYGLATQSWMMYAILVSTSLSFIAQPAAQGLISNAVAPNEQGAVQGALTSLISLNGVAAPLVATAVFSYFTAPERAVQVPGAPFFLGAVMTLAGLLIALWTFRRLPARAPQASQAEV